MSPRRRQFDSDAEYIALLVIGSSVPGVMFARGWKLAGWILIAIEVLAWLVLWAYAAQRPRTPWIFRTLWIVPIAAATSVAVGLRWSS